MADQVIEVLMIGGPADGQRIKVHDNHCYIVITSPSTRKDSDPYEFPQFTEHAYNIIHQYNHYLGVHEDLRSSEALSILINRYPQPLPAP